jgi:hypothetical protein
LECIIKIYNALDNLLVISHPVHQVGYITSILILKLPTDIKVKDEFGRHLAGVLILFSFFGVASSLLKFLYEFLIQPVYVYTHTHTHTHTNLYPLFHPSSEKLTCHRLHYNATFLQNLC